MRELSVVEQRYQAVLAVLSDGETVTDGYISAFICHRPDGLRGGKSFSHTVIGAG